MAVPLEVSWTLSLTLLTMNIGKLYLENALRLQRNTIQTSLWLYDKINFSIPTSLRKIAWEGHKWQHFWCTYFCRAIQLNLSLISIEGVPRELLNAWARKQPISWDMCLFLHYRRSFWYLLLKKLTFIY